MKTSNRRKKTLLLFLSLILSVVPLLSLAACGDGGTPDREYNESEVHSSAVELIKKSELLNEIYWGYGIPYENDTNLANGAYFPAQQTYLDEIGIQTLEDLKAKTREVFSTDMCDWVFESTLSSVGTGTDVFIARYAQKWGGVELDDPEYILVNKNYRVILKDTVEYDYESCKVIGANGNFVTVSISCTVTTEEGLTSNNTILVDLIEENDGWRIATPTYTVYNSGK